MINEKIREIMQKAIEIRNETDTQILATACRSKLTGRLFIHIGKAHGTETKVEPHDYVVIEVNEVDM